MNSGIVRVEKEGDFYLFHGNSGSVYRCHKDTYGASFYGMCVIRSFQERAKEGGLEFDVLPEDTDFVSLGAASS